MFSKKIRRDFTLAAIMVTLAILTFCQVPVFTDDYEPNDTFEDAALISPGTIKATIKPDSDVDYYKINLTGGEEIRLIYKLKVPAELRPEIRFYNSANQELVEYRNHSSNLGDSLYDSLTVAAGEFVVRVSSFTYEESDSSYTLTLSTSVPVLAKY